MRIRELSVDLYSREASEASRNDARPFNSLVR